MRRVALFGSVGLALAATSGCLFLWMGYMTDLGPRDLMAAVSPVGLFGVALLASLGGVAILLRVAGQRSSLGLIGALAVTLGLLLALYNGMTIQIALAHTGPMPLEVVAPSLLESLAMLAAGALVATFAFAWWTRPSIRP